MAESRRGLSRVRAKLNHQARRVVHSLWHNLGEGEAGQVTAGDAFARRFAEFGADSRIDFPWIELSNPASTAIGSGVYIRSYFCLEAYAQAGTVNCRIGDGVQLGHHVRIVAFNGVELAELVGVGHNTTIGDSVHDWKPVSVTEEKALWDTPPKWGRSLKVAKGAFLGNNCVVTGGITIGEFSIVEHNTVINRDVPARTIVGGYPARVLRRRLDDGTWEALEDPPLLDDYVPEPSS